MSEKAEEFFDGHSRITDERAQCPNGKLFVLRYGEIGSLAGFGHDEMTSNLPHGLPAGFGKCFTASLPEMLANVPIVRGYGKRT
jgi:hypothetical protein